MSLPKFEHVILTRFNTKEMPDGLLYDNPGADEWMEHRMPFWLACKQSVLSQKRVDFRWIISVDKRTPKRFVDQIKAPKIEIIHDPIQNVELKVSTPWIITTRIDCDDQYLPGALRKIQRRFTEEIKVIDIGVVRLDWFTGRLYQGDVGGGRSMFVSLVENSSRIANVFCRPHSNLGHGYPFKGTTGKYSDYRKVRVDVIKEPLAVMVCHDRNIANAIRKQGLVGNIKNFR